MWASFNLPLPTIKLSRTFILVVMVTGLLLSGCRQIQTEPTEASTKPGSLATPYPPTWTPTATVTPAPTRTPTSTPTITPFRLPTSYPTPISQWGLQTPHPIRIRILQTPSSRVTSTSTRISQVSPTAIPTPTPTSALPQIISGDHILSPITYAFLVQVGVGLFLLLILGGLYYFGLAGTPSIGRRRTIAAVIVPIVHLVGHLLIPGGNIFLGLVLYPIEVALLWPLTRQEKLNRVSFWLLTVTFLFLCIASANVPGGALSATVRFLLYCFFTLTLVSRLRRSTNPYWAAVQRIGRGLASPSWQIIIVGLITGMLLFVPLAYLLMKMLLTVLFDIPHNRTSVIVGIVVILLAMVTGPAAVWWSRPPRWQGRLIVGATTGVLAGAFLFGGLGGIAGPVAHLPLYNLLLSPTGYSTSEWLFRLVLSVNMTFPIVYGLFWLLISGGALIGGLTGLLTPIRIAAPVGQTPVKVSVWPLIVQVTALPLLAFTVIANATLLPILTPILQNVFDTYGLVSIWDPEWTYFAAVAQPWLALTAIQIIGLFWLLQLSNKISSLRQQAGLVASLAGLVGLALPLSLFILNRSTLQSPWLLAASLITAILGLEMLVVGWHLWRSSSTDDDPTPQIPDPPVWTATGVASGFLAAIISHQLMTVLTILLFHTSFMLAGLSENEEPNLLLATSMLATFSFLIYTWLTAYAIISAHAGWALARWHLAIQLQPQKMTDRFKTGIALSSPWWLAIGTIILCAIILAAMAVSSLFPPAGLALPTAIITLIAMRPRFIKRLPWPVLGLAFTLSFLGLLGLALRDWHSLPPDHLWLWLVYGLLVGPAVAIAYRALRIYSTTNLRLISLVGALLLIGLLGHFSQSELTISGGVSRYDGQRWEIFTPDNSVLGKQINYQFFKDNQNNLWFGSSSGVIAERSGGEWLSYRATIAEVPRFGDQPKDRLQQLERQLWFAEDGQKQLWVALGNTFGQFTADTELSSELHQPARLLTGADMAKRFPSAVLSEASDTSCIAGMAQIWDRDGNFIAAIVGHTDAVNSANISPDGKRIITTSSDGTIKLWNSDGTLLAALNVEGPGYEIDSANFSPDDKRILTASNNSGTAWLWDKDGNFLTTLEGYYTDNIKSANFSQDGTQIVILGSEAIWRWDTDGNIVYAQEGGVIQTADVNLKEKLAVIVDSNNSVQVWNTDGSLITIFQGIVPPPRPPPGENLAFEVTSANISPDGTRIVFATNYGIVELFGTDGELISILEGHTDQVNSVAFSPDGNRIVTISNDNTARLWDEDGHFITTLEGHKDDIISVSFSSDGTRMMTVGKDNQVRLWDGEGNLVTLLKGHTGIVNSAAFSPDGTRIVTAECVVQDDYVNPPIDSPITGMAFDKTGNLWLATAGQGALRLQEGRRLDDAHWEFFTAENSGLASNTVHALYIDQTGDIWFGTTSGLSRFDGTVWKTVTPPGLAANISVTTLLGDATQRLWVGTEEGGYWLDEQSLTVFDDVPGWPDGVRASVLFEDSQGGIWAGTAEGAFRFNGQRWEKSVPDVFVTAFSEGPAGIVWVGNKQGLIRYNLLDEELSLFSPDNSGLITNWVRDLHVDQDGGLWVSTFATEQVARSPWWVIGIGAIFFGYIFTNTYQGYTRTPETRARRLARLIMIEPDQLYPAVYELLAREPDIDSVLRQLAEYLTKAGDQTGAKAITALADLSPDSHLAAALQQTTSALEADSARAWAGSLHQLHHLLDMVLAAKRIPEITNLELVVNPGPHAGEVSVQAQDHSVEALPPFLAKGNAAAWRSFEKVYTALRKSHDVDAAADRLSYLAEALAATEAAHTATRSLGPPEGVVMAAIANQWRTAVTNEISAVSGRAELRLELRTRQLRRAAQVTLALHLQNTGRATAENIVVTLTLGQEFSPVGETQVRLERLPSGRSTPIEFTITPTAKETVRVVCHLTWNDRVAEDNHLEFADVVRFYEVAEEFRRIPNPFIVGHPVRSTEMFFGREDVFRYIEDNLSGPVQDRTLVLHGQRRTGKTSILYQLTQGRLGQGFITALIDMQELALLNSTGDFLNEMAYQLARAVRKAGVTVKEPPLETFMASPTRAFNRFLDTLEDNLGEQRLVVMFDEFELIENKIVEGKLDANLLSYFRSLIQHRRQLVFMFTGTHRLEEMSHDYWSILFNIALYRRVSFLSPVEATRLIRQPVAGALDIDELAVEKIINLTSGHPYFIQLICWALVNHCNAHQRNYATINDINDAVQEILTSGEAHFAYIWQQAADPERLALAGLAHTLQPGKAWARPAEILETLAAGGVSQTQRTTLVEVLDRLVAQEILEVAQEGALRYRFQIQVLQLWVQTTKSIAAVIERGQ